MKSFIITFLKRGAMFAASGPIIVAIVYLFLLGREHDAVRKDFQGSAAESVRHIKVSRAEQVEHLMEHEITFSVVQEQILGTVAGGIADPVVHRKSASKLFEGKSIDLLMTADPSGRSFVVFLHRCVSVLQSKKAAQLLSVFHFAHLCGHQLFNVDMKLQPHAVTSGLLDQIIRDIAAFYAESLDVIFRPVTAGLADKDQGDVDVSLQFFAYSQILCFHQNVVAVHKIPLSSPDGSIDRIISFLRSVCNTIKGSPILWYSKPFLYILHKPRDIILSIMRRAEELNKYSGYDKIGAAGDRLPHIALKQPYGKRTGKNRILYSTDRRVFYFRNTCRYIFQRVCTKGL